MNKPDVIIVVCGRFHYHQYMKILWKRNVLSKFIYSYKTNYNFRVPAKYLHNFPVKEYLMYLGAKVLKGKIFYEYLSVLHRIWQHQVLGSRQQGNIVHFLVHGNCFKIVHAYKKKGVKIIGEVVNAHPAVQETLLELEYNKYGMKYEAGEKIFKDKIVYELSLCDYLLVPSTFIKQSLMSHGIEAGKIKVLPYGLNEVPVVKETSYISSRQKIRLLCIAQVNFRKGVIYLLEALEQLLDLGYPCELTLVGKPDAFYMPVISKLLNNAAVTHIVHVDNNMISELMIKHDLFVMPSIEDGFGIVIAEALSVNLPVIVTKNCGAAEIVTSGLNGFVIDAFSKDAITGAVVKSIGYTFDFSQKIPSWYDYVGELEDFYSQVLTN